MRCDAPADRWSADTDGVDHDVAELGVAREVAGISTSFPPCWARDPGPECAITVRVSRLAGSPAPGAGRAARRGEQHAERRGAVGVSHERRPLSQIRRALRPHEREHALSLAVVAARPGAASRPTAVAHPAGAGPGAPNDSICTGPAAAIAASVITSRSSTWPESSAARAAGEAWICELRSSWRPGGAAGGQIGGELAAEGGRSVRCDRPDVDPRVAQTEAGDDLWGVHAGQPGAKLTAHGGRGHDHIQASGSAVADRSTNWFAARTPWASRTEHMAGSQATIMSPPTWLAIHAAAWSRAIIARPEFLAGAPQRRATKTPGTPGPEDVTRTPLAATASRAVMVRPAPASTNGRSRGRSRFVARRRASAGISRLSSLTRSRW